MKLCFDSIEEVKAFIGELKGARGGKGKDKDEGAADVQTGQQGGTAPPPMQPPGNGAAAFAGFAPPAGGAGPGPGFGAPGAQTNPNPGPDPAIVALVQRINTRVDAALASGQNTDAALAWFRTECGPNAAQATFDQIKSYHLFQQSKDKLEQIAKVMNA